MTTIPEKFDLKVDNGKQKVRITGTPESMQLMTMADGFEWSVSILDDEMMCMLDLLIASYKAIKQ